LLPSILYSMRAWAFEPVARANFDGRRVHMSWVRWKIGSIYKVNRNTMKMLKQFRKGIWFISYFCAAKDYIDGDAPFSLLVSPHIQVIYNSSFVCFHACIKMANEIFPTTKREIFLPHLSTDDIVSVVDFNAEIYFTRFFMEPRGEKGKSCENFDVYVIAITFSLRQSFVSPTL
jgi:hypothetical protein